MDNRNETRDTLSVTVSEATGFSQQACRNVLDTLLVEIICRCRDNEQVMMKGFGTFYGTIRETRPVYHFPKKEMMPMERFKTIKFKMSAPFIARINNEPYKR